MEELGLLEPPLPLQKFNSTKGPTALALSSSADSVHKSAMHTKTERGAATGRAGVPAEHSRCLVQHVIDAGVGAQRTQSNAGPTPKSSVQQQAATVASSSHVSVQCSSSSALQLPLARRSSVSAGAQRWSLWQLTFQACPWPLWECVCMSRTTCQGLVAGPSTRSR